MKEVSEATKRQQESVLNRLEEECQIGRSEGKVELYDTLYEYVKCRIFNPNTRKNYLAAILRATADHPEEELRRYRELAKTTHDFLNSERISQTLPRHRLDNMLPWYQVQDLKCKAKKILNDEDYLIYCLYTLHPPMRADYWNMRVVKYLTKKRKEDKENNYCILHDNEGRFIFNKFKTSDTHGQIDIPICDELYDMLKKTAKMDMPLLQTVHSANALSKRVTEIFEKLSGKTMGIGLLRHSYITTFLSTVRSLREKTSMAYRMGHSWFTQETYHIIENDTDGELA